MYCNNKFRGFFFFCVSQQIVELYFSLTELESSWGLLRKNALQKEFDNFFQKFRVFRFNTSLWRVFCVNFFTEFQSWAIFCVKNLCKIIPHVIFLKIRVFWFHALICRFFKLFFSTYQSSYGMGIHKKSLAQKSCAKNISRGFFNFPRQLDNFFQTFKVFFSSCFDNPYFLAFCVFIFHALI